MEGCVKYENGLNFKATELRLGLPGTEQQLTISPTKKRKAIQDLSNDAKNGDYTISITNEISHPAAKSQIVGWPPVRSFGRNNLRSKDTEAAESSHGVYVKVSMDGAPYLRKIQLQVFTNYQHLIKALHNMFKITIESEGYKESGFLPTYEDKDGDWMLVGDVPWEMFMSSCKRLRIMKGSEAQGLGCGSI